VSDPAQLQAKGLDKPFASIDFDFHLYRETGTVPSSVVERVRAAA
jgi:catechol 1,2-dioxygenase